MSAADRRAFARALAFAVLLLAGACQPGGETAPGTRGAEPGFRPDGWVTIKGQRVAVEIVETPDAMALGLGERDALPWGRGMLFPYAEPGFPRFWMKGMRFDIDIVWLREGRIVDITARVPHVPGENGPTVAPRHLTDMVLEVPAGYSAAHGWRIGSAAEVERAAP